MHFMSETRNHLSHRKQSTQPPFVVESQSPNATVDAANTNLEFHSLNPPGQIVFICVPSSVVALSQHLNQLSSINRSAERDTCAACEAAAEESGG